MDAEMMQEARVARGAHGVYLQEMWHDLLTKDEEQELGHRVQTGDHSSRNELVQGNLRLVVKMAGRYAALMPIEDLVQEGNIGLIMAAEKFDPAFGCRFTTYATWWIRQHLLQALSSQSLIRIPKDLHSDVYKVKRLERQMLQEHGRLPSRNELLKLGISKAHLERIGRGDFLTTSMDSSFSDVDDAGNLHDVLPDVSDEGRSTMRIDNIDHVEKLLDLLEDERIPPKKQQVWKKVLLLSYGMDLTAKEVGEALGITSARVDSHLRQAKHWILKKSGSLNVV